jgi:hypothetical protein
MAIELSALAQTAPVAVDDWAETDGKTVQIYVLANDSGDIDPSTLVLLTQPTLGSASVIASGAPKIKYSGDGSGTDTFQYAVCDASGACSTATVTVNLVSPATTTTAAPATTAAPTTTAATTTPGTPTATPSVVETPPTTSPPPATTVALTALSLPTTLSAAPFDPFASLTVGPDQALVAAGTMVGEPHDFDLTKDVVFLGRIGADTLKLVAVPAVMVSGIIGFLLVGLPQNALGGLLGFLVGKRRRDRERQQKN